MRCLPRSSVAAQALYPLFRAGNLGKSHWSSVSSLRTAWNKSRSCRREYDSMNYFTPAWHSGNLDDETCSKMAWDYKQHLANILPSLPPEVQTLATSINIHDGLLWKAEADPEQGLLRLALRCGDLQVGYFDLELEYQQVDFVPEMTEALRKLSAVRLDQPSLPYPNEALYDEVDQEGDFLVHRILFWHEDWRHRQAGRRLRRLRRDGRRQKRHHLRLRSDFYEELTIRFKGLGLSTTPRGSRHSVEENENEQDRGRQC